MFALCSCDIVPMSLVINTLLKISGKEIQWRTFDPCSMKIIMGHAQCFDIGTFTLKFHVNPSRGFGNFEPYTLQHASQLTFDL